MKEIDVNYDCNLSCTYSPVKEKLYFSIPVYSMDLISLLRLINVKCLLMLKLHESNFNVLGYTALFSITLQ